MPITNPGYNDNPNIYLDGNKIKFRAEGRYLLLIHIAGRTETSGRLFYEAIGSNLTLHGISYGEYAETDIVIPAQVNSTTEVYINLIEAFTVDGGQIGSSFIALSPL